MMKLAVRFPLLTAGVCHDPCMLEQEAVEKAHALSVRNRAALSRSDVCGCFYCLAILTPDAITEWTAFDDSALCPKCGIDSVLAQDSGYPITAAFLACMHERWFTLPSTSSREHR